MKITIYLFICLFTYLSVSLNGQVINSQEKEKNEGIQRNATYNLEEIKVRWKKAALENCTGVPCVSATVPGAPTTVIATWGNASASVAFEVPSNNGGRAITGYTVTSNPATSAVTGTTSPINVTGLTNGTAYTFTVIATNELGNSVASSVSTAVIPYLNCGTISDIDGNSYNTVLIGTQCWTKENLKVTKYNDGTDIPDLTTSISNPWAPTSGARTGYVGSGVPSSGYVGTYGYLYNWYAVNDSRKLCPIGWHVPTDAEWTALTSQLGGVGMAGTVMKSTSTLWNTATPPSPGTDNYGFSALPGGFRNRDGSFSNISVNAIFWSATFRIGTTAWYRHLFHDNGNVTRYSAGLDYTYGASVRCLRD